MACRKAFKQRRGRDVSKLVFGASPKGPLFHGARHQSGKDMIMLAARLRTVKRRGESASTDVFKP